MKQELGRRTINTEIKRKKKKFRKYGKATASELKREKKGEEVQRD